MAAANGIFTFVGKSGQTYTVSAYTGDSTGVPIKFSQAGKATANNDASWTAPEACVLTDIVWHTGSALTVGQLLKDSAPTGDLFNTTSHLDSVVNRPAIRVLYKKGERVGYIEYT